MKYPLIAVVALLFTAFVVYKIMQARAKASTFPVEKKDPPFVPTYVGADPVRTPEETAALARSAGAPVDPGA
jgi:hypothetical protein